MSRIRSPNYPQLSLDEALKRVKQVFDRERQHATTRDVVLKGMGYNGANGASLGALSAALKYGLLERLGEDFRISDRAVAILHPHSTEERSAAIRAAATAPALFGELLENFKGGLPSDDSLRAYLVRRGFATGALTGVIQAFRDTISLMQDTVPLGDSEPPQQVSEPMMSQTRSLPGALPVPAIAQQNQSISPLEVTLSGGRIRIVGDLEKREDVESLIRLLGMTKEFLPDKSRAIPEPKADK